MKAALPPLAFLVLGAACSGEPDYDYENDLQGENPPTQSEVQPGEPGEAGSPREAEDVVGEIDDPAYFKDQESE